jgi:hypothetical protein
MHATPQPACRPRRANPVFIVCDWIRWYPYILPALGLFVGLAAPFLFREFSEWDDVFLRAASYFRSGDTIYHAGEGYVYPPFLALLAVPFSVLPPLTERLAWYLVTVASLFMMCWWAWHLSGGGPLQGRGKASLPEHFIWLVGMACGLRYALDCFAHQQADLLLGALTLGGCAALARRRYWRAATWFGLAAAGKCTPLLWCAFLVWRGQWRPALWLVLVPVGLNLLPNLFFVPPSGTLWLLEWWHTCYLPTTGLAKYLGTWYSDPVYNQSICGALFRWFTTQWSWYSDGLVITDRSHPVSPLVLKMVVLATDLVLAVAALLILNRARAEGRAEPRTQRSAPSGQGARADWRAPPRETGEFCVILLLMLLFSPMSSKPHFCTMLLPGFYLARVALARYDRLLGFLLALSITCGFLGFRDLWGSSMAALALWLGNVTWSALLLSAGCARALYQPREAHGAAMATGHVATRRLAG